MKFVLCLSAVAVLFAGVAMSADEEKVAKEGEKAPDFKLVGTDGKDYTLKQFAGKQAVVIAWFPKAKTPGCTAECMSMRDHGEAIRKYDVAYFTASVDDPKLNKEFADELKLDYPILSDPEQKTAKAYGVLNAERRVANRWTFFIDKNGVVKHIDKDVQGKTKDYGEIVVKKLEELGIEKKK